MFSIPKSILAFPSCGVTVFILNAQDSSNKEGLNFWSEIMQKLHWFAHRLSSLDPAAPGGSKILLHLKN